MKLFFSIMLITIFTALGFGYVSLVFKIEDVVIENIVKSSDNLKKNGLNIDYEIEKNGFSLIPSIVIKNLRISHVEKDDINAFDASEILIEVNPFQDYSLKAYFKNNVKFLNYNREIDFLFKRLILEFSFYKDYKIKDLRLKGFGISINESVENIAFINKVLVNFSYIGNEGHNFEFDANGIALRNEKIDGLYFNGVLNKKINFLTPFRELIKKFSSEGGFILIKKGGFAWSLLKISFDGDIVFEDINNPLVLLNTNIYGFNDGINMLEEKGFISQKENWLSKIVLFVMARKNNKGQDYIPTKITYKNKQIFVGPILFYEFQ